MKKILSINILTKKLNPAKLLPALLLGFVVHYSAVFAMTAEKVEVKFQNAKPVWLKGREEEMNLFGGFRAKFSYTGKDAVKLKVTGSTVYRAFINGEFAGYGPARAAHGFYRVDEWDLTPHLKQGENVVAIEVAGYNQNSFYLLNQPSFVQAEVVQGEKVLAATLDKAAGDVAVFEGAQLPWRRQKIQRSTFMRSSAEAFDFQQKDLDWATGGDTRAVKADLEVTPEKKTISRIASYPRFHSLQPKEFYSTGILTLKNDIKDFYRDRSMAVSKTMKNYPVEEFDVWMSAEMQKHPQTEAYPAKRTYAPDEWTTVAANTVHAVDYGRIITGFGGAEIQCDEPTRVVMMFDEVLNGEGKIQPLRQGMTNGVFYDLQPGTYKLEMFEPFTYRYFHMSAYSGSYKFKNLHTREYANDDVWEASFNSSNSVYNLLYSAGLQSYRQNTMDTFMDCPSRERAGYLCDSYFTARASFDLTGSAKMENVFFQNFQLPAKFDHIPDGMLPMCYPSDHDASIYIPQWAMWFVVQLDEFQKRGGDDELIKLLEPRVDKLLSYLATFENSDGLLEKLVGWSFLEWSQSEKWMQDVNYPTNMLYAGALDAAAKVYNKPAYSEKAKKVRATVLEQSYRGNFFVDNAVRNSSGTLEITNNHSEMCQYFAFYFGVATTETHSALWSELATNFGPKRKETKKFPEVAYANAFIGNVLRLELLSRNGLSSQALEEAVGYYFHQAKQTGTLWEMDGPTNSLNHGFASHVCHLLNRNALGIKEIDMVNKVVRVHFSDSDMGSCEGRIPTKDGFVSLKWNKDSDKGLVFNYDLEVPAGYKIEITKDKNVNAEWVANSFR